MGQHNESLSGRVAIVTGASRGIGLACAEELAAAGAKVVITGRDQKSLEAAQAKIAGSMICAGDAADPKHIEACLDQTLAKHGRVDILVNNAGGPLNVGPMLELPADHLDATLRFNVNGPYLWARAVWQRSMKERGGVILNISSLSGITLQPAMGAYAISKAALLHMTRVLAGELGPKVRVNAIAPGVIETDATADFIAAAGPGTAARFPMQRYGKVADISKACLFLVSDDASWITGETLAIDGGALVQWGRIRSAPKEKS